MDKKISLRLCVGCGEMKDKKDMLRIVKTQEGAILPDFTGRMNGRGAYVCKSRACLEKARKKRGLERSFKMSISAETYEDLLKELPQDEEGETIEA